VCSGIRLRRPRQQRLLSLHRHDHAERVLVRWRDVDDPGPFGDLIHDQLFVVDRHACDTGTVRNECTQGQRVAQILDRHRVARLDQHASDQVDSLLAPVRHENFVRRCADRTGNTDMASDGRAQCGMAGRADQRARSDSARAKLASHP
jgi:hypothetical protein